MKLAESGDEQAARIPNPESRVTNPGSRSLPPLAVPPTLPLIVIGSWVRKGDGVLLQAWLYALWAAALRRHLYRGCPHPRLRSRPDSDSLIKGNLHSARLGRRLPRPRFRRALARPRVGTPALQMMRLRSPGKLRAATHRPIPAIFTPPPALALLAHTWRAS